MVRWIPSYKKINNNKQANKIAKNIKRHGGAL